MKTSSLLHMWLEDNARNLRALEVQARTAYSPDSNLGKSCTVLADCHAAAALVYETELAKLELSLF